MFPFACCEELIPYDSDTGNHLMVRDGKERTAGELLGRRIVGAAPGFVNLAAISLTTTPLAPLFPSHSSTIDRGKSLAAHQLPSFFKRPLPA